MGRVLAAVDILGRGVEGAWVENFVYLQVVGRYLRIRILCTANNGALFRGKKKKRKTSRQSLEEDELREEKK